MAREMLEKTKAKRTYCSQSRRRLSGQAKRHTQRQWASVFVLVEVQVHGSMAQLDQLNSGATTQNLEMPLKCN